MKIITPAECEALIYRGSLYRDAQKLLLFGVKDQNAKTYRVGPLAVADLTLKPFPHDVARVVQDIERVRRRYPAFEQLLASLEVYIVPRPAVDFTNGCCYGKEVILWGRTTQIPHCMTDYIVGHELGHAVQMHFAPTREALFREYLELRGATKGIYSVYAGQDEAGQSKWVDKDDFDALHIHLDWDLHPQEWFAEDFRYFFGADRGEEFWGHPISAPGGDVFEFLSSLPERAKALKEATPDAASS